MTKVRLVKAMVFPVVMHGMGELDCEESWALKNWCFWSMVLEKTLESPLDCKEIQPVHSEGDQPWVFFGRNNAKAETPVLWPPHAKSWLIRKDSDAGRVGCRRRRGWQRMRCLDGITDSMDVSLSELRESMIDRDALHAAIHGVTQSRTRLSDYTELNWTELKQIHEWHSPSSVGSSSSLLLCTYGSTTDQFTIMLIHESLRNLKPFVFTLNPQEPAAHQELSRYPGKVCAYNCRYQTIVLIILYCYVHEDSLERSFSEFSNEIKKCKFLLRGICLFLSFL